jgi:hypothetical protein
MESREGHGWSLRSAKTNQRMVCPHQGRRCAVISAGTSMLGPDCNDKLTLNDQFFGIDEKCPN